MSAVASGPFAVVPEMGKSRIHPMGQALRLTMLCRQKGRISSIKQCDKAREWDKHISCHRNVWPES